MHRIKRYAGYFIFILTVCVLMGCGGKENVSAEFEEIETNEMKEEVREEEPSGEPQEEPAEASSNDMGTIFVHVCGQVNSPGVYELCEGSRVFRAIECAGGATEEACEEALNLAGILADGERIYVPSEEEAADGQFQEAKAEPAGEQGKQVSINKAGKEELMTLSGIGETRAQAIIRHREQNGTFSKIEDLMNVEGIKEGTFNKIREDIKL